MTCSTARATAGTGDTTSASTGCQGSCHGIFGGRIRNFFGLMGCRGSCNGCYGSTRDRGGERPYDNRPIDRADVRPYDRGMASGCFGSGCYGGGYAMAPGGCFGSGGVSYGSCFGNMPSYGGFPSVSVPGAPMGTFGGEFAQPQTTDYLGGSSGCDCSGVGGMMSSPRFGMPVMPSDGTPTYPGIAPQNLPMTPGYENLAQPRPVNEVDRSGSTNRNYKLPLNSPTDATRGNVVVKLPADAKLFVEGRPLTVTNGERTFVTPPLPTDRDAVYSFKVEYTRGGETLAQTKKVTVRAGETTLVEFADLFAGGRSVSTSDRMTVRPPSSDADNRPAVSPPSIPFNAKTTTKSPAVAPTSEVPTVKSPFPLDQAKITVKLPPGATLYVNGAKNDRSEPVRDFVTPTLTPGKIYEYTMKAEVVRNGLPEFQEQKVEFRGGDMLAVDFTNLASNSKEDRAVR